MTVPGLQPLERLIPYARNARRHSEEQIAQLAGAIDEFGLVGSIIVRDGVIAKGHGTLAACRKLLEAGKQIWPAPGQHAAEEHRPEPFPPGQLPVTDCTGWSEAQFRAYVIADNKLAQNAGWDEELLQLELGDLHSMGFDLDLIGFSQEELEELTGFEGGSGESKPSGALTEKFGVPPFSVLNARDGWWQARKKAWLALGIRSEVGRGGGSGTPPHPPTVTQNKDGTLNYGGTEGQAERFDRQRQAGAAPGGSPRPATNYGKTKARGDGRGRAMR